MSDECRQKNGDEIISDKGDNDWAFGHKGVSGYGCLMGAIKGCGRVRMRNFYQVKRLKQLWTSIPH